MHSVLPSLNFAHRNNLHSFRSKFSSHSHKWFMRLYRLGTVLFVHHSLNSIVVLPLFFNLTPVISSIALFNKNSRRVTFTRRSISKLTYLSPSAAFLFSTESGVSSNLSLWKGQSGGRLVAILV